MDVEKEIEGLRAIIAEMQGQLNHLERMTDKAYEKASKAEIKVEVVKQMLPVQQTVSHQPQMDEFQQIHNAIFHDPNDPLANPATFQIPNGIRAVKPKVGSPAPDIEGVKAPEGVTMGSDNEEFRNTLFDEISGA